MVLMKHKGESLCVCVCVRACVRVCVGGIGSINYYHLNTQVKRQKI